jgi:V/A-type H+-transporting ATPase subunit C
MSSFDYGNARLRAIKSRLLSRRKLEALTNVSSIKGLIAALNETAYQKAIEAALARTIGIDCIIQALHHDLIETLGKFHKFYQDQAGEMVSIVLRKYDVHNLKAILRGLSKNIPPREILSSTLPVGRLGYTALAELARAPGPRASIDLLATMGFSLAQPLLKLRVDRPGAGTDELELALEQWHFQDAFQELQHVRGDGYVLRSALELEADLVNLLSTLRFAHAPAERKFLHEWLGTDKLERIFVGPGKLPFPLLARAFSQDNVEAAVENLLGTPYEVPLRAGLAVYSQSARLSDLEKQFNLYHLEWMSRQVKNDPLGIGVLLGYLALKVNEVTNIRWIAQGISLELQPDAILAEMMFAS